ncbi:MAG: winged helix-turn-helix transcriptional regulator [Nitrososphaerota archaeon]|nr:winged helix-turn-helix transcriptional regulator [Nitrososphaerota archaeon]MDG6961802.1 winged helix-turn-helix transcriptional regulator [Nitrososphaerota archaeon]MDG6970295.1 winged helix-turn-helix transcriptional regulator [Nitrososphaerota archaeon]MDG6972426.1 winged helix-turn-helix transcriptional regulator [Nitrososphaerota archaeon]MDG6986838.1 winged helix-turn-helix transcriptional regulator [Nitrososphaerota archaeon]
MDSLDAVILWDLGFDYQFPIRATNRRPSFARIAANLGINQKTVRERVRKMEENGFVKYYQTYPNVAAIKSKSSSYLFPFKDAAAKNSALAKLKLVKEILRIDECVNSLRVTVVYEKSLDLDRILALAKTLTNSEPLKLYDFQMPPVKRRLREGDWKVIKSLRYDALKPSRKIAEELGLTPRAINYRLGKLVRDRAFFVAPVFDMKHVTGTILYGLMFWIDSAKWRYAIEEITETFKQNSFCRMVDPSSSNAMFMMFTSRITDAEQNYLKAKAIEGVTNVYMDFVNGTHDCSGQIDAWLDEQTAEKRRAPEMAV